MKSRFALLTFEGTRPRPLVTVEAPPHHMQWVSVFDEWNELLKSEDDGRLYAAMLGRDENAVRLRQLMPCVGLLPRNRTTYIAPELSLDSRGVGLRAGGSGKLTLRRTRA